MRGAVSKLMNVLDMENDHVDVYGRVGSGFKRIDTMIILKGTPIFRYEGWLYEMQWEAMKRSVDENPVVHRFLYDKEAGLTAVPVAFAEYLDEMRKDHEEMRKSPYDILRILPDGTQVKQAVRTLDQKIQGLLIDETQSEGWLDQSAIRKSRLIALAAIALAAIAIIGALAVASSPHIVCQQQNVVHFVNGTVHVSVSSCSPPPSLANSTGAATTTTTAQPAISQPTIGG